MKDQILKLFSGKKSYLAGGALVALGVSVALGYAELPKETFEALAVALTGAMGMALRAGLGKLAPAAEAAPAPAPEAQPKE